MYSLFGSAVLEKLILQTVLEMLLQSSRLKWIHEVVPLLIAPRRLMNCPSSIFVRLFGPLRRLKNSITTCTHRLVLLTIVISRVLSTSISLCYVCTTTHTLNQSRLHQSIPSVQMKFNSISIEEYESRLEVLSCDYSHDTRFLSSSTNHSSFLINSLHSM